MVQPSPSFQTVPVYGTWRTLKGDPTQGKIRFTVSTRVVSITDDIIFPGGTVFEVPLDPEFGSINIELPAVDDTDNFPSNWFIKVEEKFAPGYGVGLTYLIQPRLSMLPGGLDLRQVIPTATITDQPNALVRGVAGGLAALDSQGRVLQNGVPLGSMTVVLQSDVDALEAEIDNLPDLTLLYQNAKV